MVNELVKLLKSDEIKVAYYLGLFYGKIKTSERLSTFYGTKDNLDKLSAFLGFYVSRRGIDYICIESIRLSRLLTKFLPVIIKSWELYSCEFRNSFTKGYYDSNIIELKLGSTRFKYIKGKKRILKELETDNSYLVQFSNDYILYIIEDGTSIKKISDFDKLFNINNREKYKAIIGLLIGDGHMKKYDYIQITHTDKQKEYITFLKIILDYWGISCTIGRPSNTTKVRKNGSPIINHYFYITLDNKDYFKNRVSLTNKQVNSYLASRINDLALLFWYLDDGSNTPTGINLYTNGFDKMSQNMLIKYLGEKYSINPKIYITQGYNYLHLCMKDSQKYFDIIDKYSKYLPNCFKHKFNSFNNHSCMI